MGLPKTRSVITDFVFIQELARKDLNFFKDHFFALLRLLFHFPKSEFTQRFSSPRGKTPSIELQFKLLNAQHLWLLL